MNKSERAVLSGPQKANPIVSNALRDNKTIVFKQCFGKHLHIHACQACDQQDACSAEA